MKHLLLLILQFTILFADSYVKDFISEDHTNFKNASYEEYISKQLKEFTIKFEINTLKLGNETYYLTIISDKDFLVFTNTNYEIINNTLVVKLDKNQINELFFKYIYENPQRPGFRWNIITDFEYNYLLKSEGILYGIAYGIILCAFLYYIIIYFSTKMRCFLYYSLMQFFVLLSLIGFVYFSYKPYPTQIPQAIVDTCETLSFLFTLLFAQTILNTKIKMPKIHMFINLFVILNILDLIAIFFYKYSILYEYLAFYIGFLIPSFVGCLAIFKGNKYAIIYTIGWLTVSLFIYIAEHWQITPISGIYVIHIGAPIESLIFSFALGYMLKDLVEEKNQKEKLLIHQSKLASMGEMINNIAHQWRQPLTHLGFINMNLQLLIEDEALGKEYLKEKIKESNIQLDFMSKTIDNFRDFYKPNKQKELFFISEAIKRAIEIMNPILIENGIDFEFNIIDDKEINAYENEYSQVVLNLLTNAKDALISRNIINPLINITLKSENLTIITTVTDNAGGIESNDIEQIFEPYFTTKEKGSGIGLYMSRIIIENHFKGRLEILNSKDGASFSIIS